MNRQFWWQSVVAVCISMFFGWGFELGLNTKANAVERTANGDLISSSLVCSDGTPIKDKLDNGQKQSLEMLSEFGGQARTLWKSCICEESAGIACTALELEMMDQIKVSQVPQPKIQSKNHSL